MENQDVSIAESATTELGGQNNGNPEPLADEEKTIDLTELRTLRSSLIPGVKAGTLQRDFAFKQFHESALKQAKQPVMSTTDIKNIMTAYQDFMDDLDGARTIGSTVSEKVWKKGYFDTPPDGSLYGLYQELDETADWRMDMSDAGPAHDLFNAWVERKSAPPRRSLDDQPQAETIEPAIDEALCQTVRLPTVPEDALLPAGSNPEASSAAKPLHKFDEVTHHGRIESEYNQPDTEPDSELDSPSSARRIPRRRRCQNKWKTLKDQVRAWFTRRRRD